MPSAVSSSRSIAFFEPDNSDTFVSSPPLLQSCNTSLFLAVAKPPNRPAAHIFSLSRAFDAPVPLRLYRGAFTENLTRGQTTSLTARTDVVLIHLRLYSIACRRCYKLGSPDFRCRYQLSSSDFGCPYQFSPSDFRRRFQYRLVRYHFWCSYQPRRR